MCEVFKAKQNKKNIQLKPSSFNLKDFFSKMMQNSDFMHSKLIQMLNKDSNTLHAFIQLGGLSKICKLLKSSYNNNNQRNVIKWLQILNHDNFPIDIELIRVLGLGQFINDQIKNKWQNVSTIINLTACIADKWIKAAKESNSKKISTGKRVLFFEKDLCEKRIIFKKNDKPIQINEAHKTSNHKKSSRIESILKASKNNKNLIENVPNDLGDFTMDNQIGNGNEYTLEYVDIEDDDHDIAMDDMSEDEDFDLMQNKKDMKETIAWHCPLSYVVLYIIY